MLTFKQLGEMGYCPKTKYGFGKPLPLEFKLKESVPHEIFIRMPLQLNVLYSTDNVNGSHILLSKQRKL